MNKRKLLEKVLSGSKNVSFHDMVALVEAFGFTLARSKGSHFMFTHPHIPELVNLQKKMARPNLIKYVSFWI